MKLGIETIKKSVGKLMKLGKTIAEVWKDKKVTLAEWPKVGIAMTAIPGIISDAEEAWAEVKEMDAQERTEFNEWFKQEFDIANDKVEQKVEDVFSLVNDTYTLGVRWYEWVDSLDEEPVETEA